MTSKPETPATGPQKPPGAKAAPPPPTLKLTDPDELLLTLGEMNDAAVAQGFTLGQVIEWAAQAAYGISILPPPPATEAPADD